MSYVGAGPSERAVAYVRVSMARHGMISPELQTAAITQHCERLGYQIVVVLEDLDLSGRFWQNRQVDTAISMLEDDLADVIVVWRWSRIARNRLDWAVAVDRVESAGGRLESATEGFDVSTATGRFARGILAEFSAYESDRMGDVWREVRERRARLGLTATGHAQFGYTKINGSYIVHRSRGPVMASLYRRYLAGESFRSLALWLNDHHYTTAAPRSRQALWQHSTVSNVMDRGFAAGYVISEGRFLPGAHKALITEDEWQAYLRRRKSTRWRARTDRDGFLLDGLVNCSCGTPMVPEGASLGAKPKYRCRRHGLAGRSSTISQHRIDPLVLRWLEYLSTDSRASVQARLQAGEWAERQWLAARASAHRLAGLEPELVTTGDLDRIEAHTKTPDPVHLAHALVEDWTLLSNAQRRDRLSQLAKVFIVNTDYVPAKVDVSTTWGQHMTLPGFVILRSNDPGSSPRRLIVPAGNEPSDSQLDRMLTASEAARFVGARRETIGQWRRAGLLAAVTIDGRYLYDIIDLRLIVRGPRRAGGMNRSWVQEQLRLRASGSPHDPIACAPQHDPRAEKGRGHDD